MQVISSDDDRARHLRGDHSTSQDTPANGNVASEGAFLVYTVRWDKEEGGKN